MNDPDVMIRMHELIKCPHCECYAPILIETLDNNVIQCTICGDDIKTDASQCPVSNDLDAVGTDGCKATSDK